MFDDENIREEEVIKDAIEVKYEEDEEYITTDLDADSTNGEEKSKKRRN